MKCKYCGYEEKLLNYYNNNGKEIAYCSDANCIEKTNNEVNPMRVKKG